MHIAVYCLLTILAVGLAHQLITQAIPPGTPRNVMLIALAAGGGLLLFDRIARAAPLKCAKPPISMPS